MLARICLEIGGYVVRVEQLRPEEDEVAEGDEELQEPADEFDEGAVVLDLLLLLEIFLLDLLLPAFVGLLLLHGEFVEVDDADFLKEIHNHGEELAARAPLSRIC